MGKLQAEATSSVSSTLLEGRRDSSPKFEQSNTFAIDDSGDTDEGLSPPDLTRTGARTALIHLYLRRFLLRARSRYPSLYERTRKFVLYVRGPRPKIDLPGILTSQKLSSLLFFLSDSLLDPTPILNSRGSFRGREWKVAVEPALLRLTRPFTSWWILAILTAGYIISLSFFVREQFFLIPADDYVDCTSTYWLANDGCGLDGDSCLLSMDQLVQEFRCPAQCTQVTLANPRTIGNIQIDHVPVIVGGGDPNKTYRGDSFICSAAVHA